MAQLSISQSVCLDKQDCNRVLTLRGSDADGSLLALAEVTSRSAVMTHGGALRAPSVMELLVQLHIVPFCRRVDMICRGWILSSES